MQLRHDLILCRKYFIYVYIHLYYRSQHSSASTWIVKKAPLSISHDCTVLHNSEACHDDDFCAVSCVKVQPFLLYRPSYDILRWSNRDENIWILCTGMRNNQTLSHFKNGHDALFSIPQNHTT